jgi:hypothetical protein
MVIFAPVISAKSASLLTQAGKLKSGILLYHAPVSSKEEALLPLLLSSTAVSLSSCHLLQRHFNLLFYA